jgi:hypothetical protein
VFDYILPIFCDAMFSSLARHQIFTRIQKKKQVKLRLREAYIWNFTFWDGGQEDKRLVADTCPNLSFFLNFFVNSAKFLFVFKIFGLTHLPRIYWVFVSRIREVLCCVLPSDHGIWNYFTADRPLNTRITASRWRYCGYGCDQQPVIETSNSARLSDYRKTYESLICGDQSPFRRRQGWGSDRRGNFHNISWSLWMN